MRLSSLSHLLVSSQSQSVPLPSFHSFLARFRFKCFETEA